MNPKKQTLLLIDAHAIIHRAFHALPPLTTSDGTPINAVYGYLLILLRALKDLQPDYVAVAFDSPGKTFRHKQFSAYKAHRVTPPDELVAQFPLVREVTAAFSFPVIAKTGYEADDIIGTLADGMKKHSEIHTIIITGDLDLLQLVNSRTAVLKLHKGVKETVLFDEKMVKEKIGVTPAQIPDFKGLRGDASDNIPGVKGIGEKGAVKLLQQFGTIENIYKHLDTLGGREHSALAEHKDNAFISKELATIVRDAPIPFTLDDALVHFDRANLVRMFQKYEFKSLLGQLNAMLGKQEAQPPRAEGLFAEKDAASAKPKRQRGHERYQLVADATDILHFAKTLQYIKMFAVDTETTGLNPLHDTLVGMSFSWKKNEAFYVPCPDGRVPDVLIPILENPTVHKTAHNSKFDIEVFHHADVYPQGFVFDTMLASYLCISGSRGHGLDYLAFAEFGYEMQPIEELIGKGKNQISMHSVPVEKVSWYACEDADFTWRLYDIFSKRITELKMETLMRDIEMPTVHVLVTMEEAGVKIDAPFLATMSTHMHTRLAELERNIHKMAGTPFNVASSVQLKEILFDHLQLSTKKIAKIKTGFSTAAAELEKLRGTHPIIELILEHRELSKLTSTYVDALPKLCDPKTQRIHTSFNQTIAATGRLSSSEPNLQNIPIRTELGREIRKAFVAQHGMQLLSCDYSQVELRVVAHLSDDKVMKEAFAKNQDIHCRTAAELHDVPLDNVTREQRRQAKAINFGILYGMGAGGIVREIKTSREEAHAFLEKYFSIHTGIHRYIEEVKAFAREHHYAETLFGRRRPLPDIAASNPMLRAAAERAAVNMPVQGTVADIMKLAMIAVQREIDTGDIRARMLLQVHDELVFEIARADVAKAARRIQHIMENIYTISIPLLVNVSVGSNWGELQNLIERDS